MNINDELNRLEHIAIEIVQIVDPSDRHKRGFALHNDLADLHDDHILTPDQQIHLMSIVKLLVNIILVDAVEGNPYIKP